MIWLKVNFNTMEFLNMKNPNYDNRTEAEKDKAASGPMAPEILDSGRPRDLTKTAAPSEGAWKPAGKGMFGLSTHEVWDANAPATEQGKWLLITEDRAWELCYPQSAPYAGYIVQTKTANVRCIRDKDGHKFAAMYLNQ